MAQRKEVFQSKVIHKLYPDSPKEEETTTRLCAESLSKKIAAKRTIDEDTNSGKPNTLVEQIYTVQPPPPNYKTDAERSVLHTELESKKSELVSSNETDQAKDPEEKKRRRKRKKRKDGVTGLNQAAVTEGEECISKNKKRKLKKKKHKEKLLCMGLMPRAAAVEFTYQREELQQEEDDEDKAAE